MFIVWLPLLSIIVDSEIHAQSTKNCYKFRHLDCQNNLLQCETFCITHECKKCRMICLSDRCDFDSNSKDCRTQQFLTTNCSMAIERMKHQKMIQGNNNHRSCEFHTGYVPHIERISGHYLYEAVDLSLKCGNQFPLSPLLFEMKGEGEALILFKINEFLAKYNRSFPKTIITLRILIYSDMRPSIGIRILHKDQSAEGSLKSVYQFWIKTLTLQSGHVLITMGEGHFIGRDTLIDATSWRPVEDIASISVFSSLGNIVWKFKAY